MTAICALGIMTGTSMDGMDFCVAEVSLEERENAFTVLETASVPFTDDIKALIRKAVNGPADDVGALHFELSKQVAGAVNSHIDLSPVEVVAFHGQTVAHGDAHYTLQVGSGPALASHLQRPVLTGVRDGDIAVGGNGAPLMPYLDWLIGRQRPSGLVALNLGGVANISVVPAAADRNTVVGFDTGPGMGLIDETAKKLFESDMDRDARFSKLGSVDTTLLGTLMDHPFILKPPPKSTGRDEFGGEMVDRLWENFKGTREDFIRTLVRFTAASVTHGLMQSPTPSDEYDLLIVSGGGVHHPLMMEDLRVLLPDIKVASSAVLDIDPDYKEALLMAVIAAAYLANEPANMPSVTGARQLTRLGQLASPLATTNWES